MPISGRVDDFAASVPRQLGEDERVALTSACRDADAIPKVEGAGEVSVFEGQRIQTMHNGLRVVADGYYGAWMTRLIELLRGHHEPQEEAAVHEVLRHLGSHATMLEVGAFWSYYSLWFLKDRPHRRAFALEPDPAHLALGRRNAALNGLRPMFRQGVLAVGDARRATLSTESSGWQEVDAVPLTEIAAALGGRIDLLLCDAQGAETDLVGALQGLSRTGAIGFVILSTHAEAITGDPLTHQRCLRAMKALGAHVLAEHDVHESFSGDGLIVASFDAVPADWRDPPLTRNRYASSLFRNPLYDLAECRTQAAADVAPETSVPLQAVVRALYRQLLSREADPDGLAFHLGETARTRDLDRLVEAFRTSPELGNAAGSPRQPVAAALPPGRNTAPGRDATIVVVDVGAQRLSYETDVYAPLAGAGYGLRVIGFEPIETRRVERAAEGDRSVTLLPHFVGDGERRPFHLASFDATSSLLPFNDGTTDAFVELRDLRTVSIEEVATVRLDQALADLPRIDFLKLDIQGFEAMALQHATDVLARTSVVHCEVLFADIYRGQGFFSDVDRLLRDRGFEMIDLVFEHRGGYVVPSGGVTGDRLLWGDAIFMRRLTGSENAGARSLQAAIAVHVYDKPGLAERIVTGQSF